MEYFKLVAGMGLLAVFIWLLDRTSKRKGLLVSVLRVDMVIGIIAALYLIVSSTTSIFS